MRLIFNLRQDALKLVTRPFQAFFKARDCARKAFLQENFHCARLNCYPLYLTASTGQDFA